MCATQVKRGRKRSINKITIRHRLVVADLLRVPFALPLLSHMRLPFFRTMPVETLWLSCHTLLHLAYIILLYLRRHFKRKEKSILTNTPYLNTELLHLNKQSVLNSFLSWFYPKTRGNIADKFLSHYKSFHFIYL